MRRKIIALIAIVGMLTLVSAGNTTQEAARQALDLCIRSVIPSLFPFLVLSTIVTAAFREVRFPPVQWLSRHLGIPAGAEGLLPVSVLGGYPAGAAAIGQLYAGRQLSRSSARRLLMFCSNAGPAFIFGIVAAEFSQHWAPWVLWGIQILSSLVVGFFAPSSTTESISTLKTEADPTDALSRSVWAMGKICGWIVMFRTVMAVLDRYLSGWLPNTFLVVIHGLLELTWGCLELGAIQDESLRFLIAAVLLNCGGLCILLQTASVTEGLGIGSYLKGKALQTGISLMLSWVVLKRQMWGMALLVLFAIFLREMQKRSSNPSAVGV